VEGDAAQVRISLLDGKTVLKTEVVDAATFAGGLEWSGLAVEPWWPNGEGARNLYRAECALLDDKGEVLDVAVRRVGFKNAAWQPCENAPAEADPWICVINGKPVFLQGIDWTPIRPTFADLTREDFQKRIELYAELGCNIFLVWGGAYLETEEFYELCDAHGILVRQEFPLCSGGHENWPHEDEPSMANTSLVDFDGQRKRAALAASAVWKTPAENL
jgi:beta-mannosidase